MCLRGGGKELIVYTRMFMSHSKPLQMKQHEAKQECRGFKHSNKSCRGSPYPIRASPHQPEPSSAQE